MSLYDFGFRLPVHIKRTRRQGSVQLRIGDGTIRLLVPQTLPCAEIINFVEHKRSWIDEHLQRVEAIKAAEPDAPQLEDGDRLWWRGEQLPIETLQGTEAAFDLRPDQRGFQLQLPKQPLARDNRIQLIANWYQQRACALLPDRLWQMADRTGLQPSACKVRFYKSRWGSCNRRGQITLNTSLMMAPDDVIDYVLIHELCHLKELNHSPSYWAWVVKWCPDFKQHRRWLREHERLLTIG